MYGVRFESRGMLVQSGCYVSMLYFIFTSAGNLEHEKIYNDQLSSHRNPSHTSSLPIPRLPSSVTAPQVYTSRRQSPRAAPS